MTIDDNGEDSAARRDIKAAFFIARAEAIDSYARYEQIIGKLFAHLLGTPLDYAGVVFFKINNAPTRIQIIDRLLKKRYGKSYNAFFDSIDEELRKLDIQRNHIVHGTVLYHSEGQLVDGKIIRRNDIRLTPPNIFDRTTGTVDITYDDLYKFCDKCDFFRDLLSKFHTLLTAPDTLPTASHDIFRQEVIYRHQNNAQRSQKKTEP